MLNIYQATYKAIVDGFSVGWQGSTPVKYENKPFQKTAQSWVSLCVDWGSEMQSGLQTDWRYQVGGLIHVGVHLPINEDKETANKLSELALDILAHRQFRCGNVGVKTFDGEIVEDARSSTDIRLLCKCQFVGEIISN